DVQMARGRARPSLAIPFPSCAIGEVHRPFAVPVIGEAEAKPTLPSSVSISFDPLALGVHGEGKRRRECRGGEGGRGCAPGWRGCSARVRTKPELACAHRAPPDRTTCRSGAAFSDFA